jgi:hypothetical protein
VTKALHHHHVQVTQFKERNKGIFISSSIPYVKRKIKEYCHPSTPAKAYKKMRGKKQQVLRHDWLYHSNVEGGHYSLGSAIAIDLDFEWVGEGVDC